MPYIIIYLCSGALFWASGTLLGFTGWLSGKESLCQRHGFDPWSRRIPRVVGQLSPCAPAVKPVCPEPVRPSSEARVPRARAPQQEKPLQREA